MVTFRYFNSNSFTGVGGYDGITTDSKGLVYSTMQNTMKLLNHTYVDILKMDIEGGEFSWAQHELNSVGKRIGQLLIEMHSPAGDVFALVVSLEKYGLRQFHQEVNRQKALWGAEYAFVQADMWSHWDLNKHSFGSL
jgi:hypothetical protein